MQASDPALMSVGTVDFRSCASWNVASARRFYLKIISVITPSVVGKELGNTAEEPGA